LKSDYLEDLLRSIPCIVEWRKDERGFAVRPVNQPALESVVEMPVDVRDRFGIGFIVLEWLKMQRSGRL